MNLTLGTPPRGLNLIGEKPVHDRFGLADARLIAPGAADRSVLIRRAAAAAGSAGRLARLATPLRTVRPAVGAAAAR
jgi:hypothetical protein